MQKVTQVRVKRITNYLGVTVHNEMETRSTVSHQFSKDVFKHIFYSALHGAVVAVPFCMALLVCVHCLAYAAIYRFFRTHEKITCFTIYFRWISLTVLSWSLPLMRRLQNRGDSKRWWNLKTCFKKGQLSAIIIVKFENAVKNSQVRESKNIPLQHPKIFRYLLKVSHAIWQVLKKF